MCVRIVIFYRTMNTIPDNTRMKTNNEAAVIPTKASEDKSEKNANNRTLHTNQLLVHIHKVTKHIKCEAGEWGHPMCSKKRKLIVNFEFKYLNTFTPMRSSVTLKYSKFRFFFELLNFWYLKFRKINDILNQKSSNLKGHTVFKVSPFMLFDSHI